MSLREPRGYSGWKTERGRLSRPGCYNQTSDKQLGVGGPPTNLRRCQDRQANNASQQSEYLLDIVLKAVSVTYTAGNSDHLGTRIGGCTDQGLDNPRKLADIFTPVSTEWASKNTKSSAAIFLQSLSRHPKSTVCASSRPTRSSLSPVSGISSGATPFPLARK